jgi:hypothetical protein
MGHSFVSAFLEVEGRFFEPPELPGIAAVG